ncbi:mitochondrial chaperone bcs1, partial [Leptodontidium sp. MPI-SDFR-AT-0119]
VINSVGSGEFRVLIITTNYIKLLDEALIRPGRVDIKVELGLANKKMTADLFYIVFKPMKVDQLAGEFTTKVPELEFSPAEISLFLFEHRQSPGHAIDNVEIWMAKIQEDRGKLVMNS